MATIKAYTDIEQSHKLAKILPVESADMYYTSGVVTPDIMIGSKQDYRCYTMCWSLAALLSILPTIDYRNAEFCKDIRFDKWHIYYHSTATLPIIDTERYENLIDACYEMVLKLHEMKKL